MSVSILPDAGDCSATVAFAMSNEEFQLFRELVRQQTGIALSDAKKLMLASRLAPRLRAHSLSSYRTYYRLVREHDPGGEELRELINCVTTNKTSFFREPAHFDFLRDTILPGIRDRARHGESSVRIWSAPCSTGEEAYSIAITVCEVLKPLVGWDVRILASDLDTNVLARASRGIYDKESIAHLPLETTRNYFLRGKGAASATVKVKPQVRALIDFRRINLIEPHWPVDDLFDVIFCRNLLIYFERATQDELVRRLVKQLKPSGYLIVGQSEYLHWMRDFLEPVHGTIYRTRRMPKGQ